MTDIEGFLAIYGHSDNLLNNKSGYKIYNKEAGAAATVINLSGSSTSYTLVNLKKWTDYIFRIKVINGDFDGPWSAERRVWMKQDGLFF